MISRMEKFANQDGEQFEFIEPVDDERGKGGGWHFCRVVNKYGRTAGLWVPQVVLLPLTDRQQEANWALRKSPASPGELGFRKNTLEALVTRGLAEQSNNGLCFGKREFRQIETSAARPVEVEMSW